MQSESQLAAQFFRAKDAAYTSPMTVRNWQAQGRSDFVLVDVRKAQPLPTKLIPGSIDIPLDELAERMHLLPKEKLLVLYCWDTWCSLATTAAVQLSSCGYDVKELNGGIAAWTALNLPVADVSQDKNESAMAVCTC
jgi:rhodanese-related sulfurtransferase